MLSIGDLARHTGVSVRMLRHYDALGLVTPERVDPATGYRWYAVSQVGRVNSVVALKELGFTLAGVPMAGGVIRTYYGRPDGSKIEVTVALPLAPGADPVAGLDLVELPAEDHGATVTHCGPSADVADAWHTLDVGLEERGLESFGPYRQVHIEDADDHVVIELQCPVRTSGSGCS